MIYNLEHKIPTEHICKKPKFKKVNWHTGVCYFCRGKDLDDEEDKDEDEDMNGRV